MARDETQDIFEGPGFTLRRQGRHIEIKTHRTPEEQQQLRQRMREARPKILASIKQKTEQFLAIVHSYTSLDVVANLFVREGMYDPNEYKETDLKEHPHYVEHAAILELKDTSFELREPVLVDERDVQRAFTLLDEIFDATMWYYLTESALADANGPPSRLDELRYITILHGIAVRSPAYAFHWRELLRGLFGGSPLDQILETHDLGIDAALKIIEAI